MAIANPVDPAVVLLTLRGIMFAGVHVPAGTVMRVGGSFGMELKRSSKARDATDAQVNTWYDAGGADQFVGLE